MGPSHDQLSTSALPPAATSAIPPAATSTTSATTSKSVPPATTSVPVPTTTSQSLPIFSDYVVANVLSNDTHLVWNKMINETAYYYMAMNPEMGRDNSSSDYRHVGQAMYKKYPYIGRSGTQPWVRKLMFNRVDQMSGDFFIGRLSKIVRSNVTQAFSLAPIYSAIAFLMAIL